MEQKALVVIVVILLLVGILLFVPKGKEFRTKYLDDHFKKIGYFLKGIAVKGKVIKPFEGSKLSVTVSDVSSISMNGQSFDLKGDDFEAIIVPSSISMDGSSVTFSSNPLLVRADSMSGTISFSNDLIVMSGKTNQLALGDFGFNKTGISFSVSGYPISFSLSSVKKNIIAFQDISGSLKWTGLKGTSPLLKNDRLELYDFDGSIGQIGGNIVIQGTVSKMKLNGVNIVI
ncbi:MAG: hypothetical protein J4428_00560 [Candidatus Aenigmarchaeota archaeon]|nr:hypothetical protein [Candidatus Aenigmarchaeota archaeon]